MAGAHRHTPEIIQNLAGPPASPVTVSFTPVLAPMPRGILASCTAALSPGVDDETARTPRTTPHIPRSRSCICCQQAAGRPPEPCTAPTPCSCRSGWTSTPGRLVAVGAIDNLTKGTAGAAVQCLNLALGLPESTGLPAWGIAP